MKKAAIIYKQFYNEQGTARALGGVETYLYFLSRLLLKMDYEVVFFQHGSCNFEFDIDGFKVKSVAQNKFDINGLYEKALDFVKNDNGLLIFGADQQSVKTDYPYSINIMHGIAWDLPARFLICNGGRYGLIGKLPFFGPIIAKKMLAQERLKQIDNTNHAVLVDYNSINWYRTQVDSNIRPNYQVILNFVSLPEGYTPPIERHNDEIIKVLFARRFQEYRGSKIMAQACERLLKENSNVEVSFAGEGPEENNLKEQFKNTPQVKFTSYLPENSIEFHEQFHIAVVPSLASEGSSLSLAEGMGTGCAVIASDVGGMTNMIVDRHNGLLIKPTADELYLALNQLVNDHDLRIKLAQKAYETAKSALNIDVWETKWRAFIESVVK